MGVHTKVIVEGELVIVPNLNGELRRNLRFSLIQTPEVLLQTQSIFACTTYASIMLKIIIIYKRNQFVIPKIGNLFSMSHSIIRFHLVATLQVVKVIHLIKASGKVGKWLLECT